jgi:hypothetical protein
MAIGSDDPGYEEARQVYNAMIDQRPALIVRAADVADVIATSTSRARQPLPGQPEHQAGGLSRLEVRGQARAGRVTVD